MRCLSDPCAEDDAGSSTGPSFVQRLSWAPRLSSPTGSIAAVTGARTAAMTVRTAVRTAGTGADPSLTS